MAGEEINISNISEDSSEKYFHTVIGCIEDILMDEQFVKLHNNFMEQYWRYFEDDEENKLIYTDIFKKYNESIEKFIETRLVALVDNFNMAHLEKELVKRQNELDGEVFEVLSTFTDFIAFKEKFLDYKAMKEGKVADLSKEFVISSLTSE